MQQNYFIAIRSLTHDEESSLYDWICGKDFKITLLRDKCTREKKLYYVFNDKDNALYFKLKWG